MKSILDRAITAMRNASVDNQKVEDAAARVYEKLQAEHNKVVQMPIAERISSCADFQALIPAYLTKSLTEKRALLLEDHTRECVNCRHALQDARSPHPVGAVREAQARQRAALSYDRPGAPRSASAIARSLKDRAPLQRTGPAYGKYALVAVAATVVLVVGLTQSGTIQDLLWPIEVSAVAQTVDGNLFVVAGATMQTITAGHRIERDQVIRTGKNSGAILQLADGSKIEMRERSELSLDRASDGVRVELERGSVIVTAAKQRSGHMYVATEDCTVSVVGTVFSVNTGTKGSRVSVVEGEVRVEHGSSSSSLVPGQQLSTNPVLGTVPIEQDIAWSREAEVHLELLREFLRLNQDLGARIASQELRYSSNLINVLPENTAVLAAMPNMTESFGQAYDTFRQRILENPALRTWWDQHMRDNDG
ncbi:MAG: FecR domain-containing protein, partial [Acidobacteria bacterium]|nr:FecR domain-containing protein [Acidobacteriota bacterium]